MSTTARRALTVLLALAGVALPVTAIFVPAGLPAAAPVCSTSWGSAPEDVRALGRAPVTAVGTGSDRCWDRVVFTLPGPAAGYSVAYVDTVVQDGSGDVLPVPGGAKLRVQLHHPAYDDQRQRHPHAVRQPRAPAGRRQWLPNPAFGDLWRQLRGRHDDRRRHPHPRPVPGVHARRPGLRFADRHRRGAPLVTASGSPAGPAGRLVARTSWPGDRVGGPTGKGDGPPPRKVRTPQGRVVVNGNPGRPAGKCHREQTASRASAG